MSRIKTHERFEAQQRPSRSCGRGVARALKATQIGWAKARGYEALQTRNEERNAPIRHLNAEFGYEPAVGRVYLRGPLSDR